MNVSFPKNVEEASAAGKKDRSAHLRAGGTDLQELIELGIAEGDIVDLRDLAHKSVTRFDGGVRIGAQATIAQVAADPIISKEYPGLARSAGALATPQIRAVATMGGNLTQRVRCWYFRNPDLFCAKKGGESCLAREGDHLYHSIFQQGECVAVHASTVGMALLAYDAKLEIFGGEDRSIADFFGDGKNPEVENTLEPGEVITTIRLPVATPGEKAAYFRAIHRARAEWPLVEAMSRLVIEGGTIQTARVVVGGVANRPRRLTAVEQKLEGKKPTAANFEAAVKVAAQGADPLPMTKYKVTLLPETVLETLERAVA